MDEKFLSDFMTPGSEFRGKPFWAWNGKLDPEELRRQIRIFHRMGLGGFFMHSRVGLDTEYLGEDWFDCVEACIEQADELSMEAWLYDEDRWPSGAAGGIVTRNPDYRRRHLVVDRYDEPAGFQWTPEVVAAFSANIENNAASRVEPLEPGSENQVRSGRSVLAFRIETDQPTPWHNGQTYLDTMNDEAVRRFIEVTHEKYASEVGEDFGGIIPGIFTDEPNYGSVGPERLPWTGRLPEVFRERYGYDLLPHLVELFFDVDGKQVSQPRYHYHDCITHLFVDAFARQIGRWCEENNLLHTGHVLAEETLRSQTRVVGSGMRFYEYMQAPGIDILTEHRRELNTAKQCSSVANQCGRQWRLSELYGCSGWDFSFEAHKAVGDWQAACGINLRCQHLSWYTMLGEAKRDYPASIAYQSPWWEFYDKVEGYFARVHAAMGRGAEVRDLLVIHPIESVWTMRNDDEIEQYDSIFERLAIVLTSGHVDFDYGDEEMIARRAEIDESGDETVFKLGEATYKAVLIPPLKTIRKSTLDLLKKFHDAGGLLVFVGQPPVYVDALASDEPGELASSCRQVEAVDESMLTAVADRCKRLAITGPGGNELSEVMYMLREDERAFYLFLANTGHLPRNLLEDSLALDRTVDHPEVIITGFGECRGTPVEPDPETGAITEAVAAKNADGWTIKTSLPRIGSRLFVVPKGETSSLKAIPRKDYRDVSSQELNPERWEISLSEDNPLLLDRPRCRIGAGEWREPEEILRVDCAVRDALGIEHRGGRMVQPWARRKRENPRSIPVQLSYEFGVEHIPSGELRLALERPDVFDIKINGCPVSSDAVSGWWVDRSLETVPIDPALLHRGRNELSLRLDYPEDFSGLEIVYLLGHFGTECEGTELSVIAPPEALVPGDWVGQGLTFYSGSVCYRHRIAPPELKENQQLVVRLGDYRGVAARVLVNGASAGIAAWEPNEVDITEAVAGAGGEVELGIEVIGHRRNSHGPLHIAEKWPDWTGPEQFLMEGEGCYEGYQLVPAGLMSAPGLVVRQEVEN